MQKYICIYKSSRNRIKKIELKITEMYDGNILFVTAMLVVQNLIPAESSRNPS